ncbi:MAG: sugar-binding domain-containing protein [Muribaculaceae bacterium]
MRRAISILFCICLCAMARSAEHIDLSGQWRFQTDSLGVGESEAWFGKRLNDCIMLPGTTDEARKGTPNTLRPELTKPQLLRLTRRYSYVGKAWYQRDFNVSSSMAGKPLLLTLERVMWTSRVWIDGKPVDGKQESLVAPHRFTLPALGKGTHTITLCIDNSKQYDITVNDLAHSYTNDTQVMWNGVLGKMQLSAIDKHAIGRVDVYPDVDTHCAKVVVATKARQLQFAIDGNRVTPKRLNDSTYIVDMGDDVKLWSEFSPRLYKLEVTSKTDSKTVSFGMRKLDNSNRHISVNGKRIWLRGTLDCCIFPLTGTPPMTEEGWEKEFNTARRWGLNHLRFHSWCPPEAAFRVADRMGFYLQVELPLWSLTVNKDEKTPAFLYREYESIVEHYGNHPSFCFLSCGNELQPDFDFLNNMVRHMKQRDTRHLYTTTSFTFEKGHGGHQEPEDQFFVSQWTDNGWVRGQGVFDSESPRFDKDFSEATSCLNVPLVTHEVGQYAVYPNMNEIPKYTGTLDPLNLKAISNDLGAKGLLHRADDYLKASGNLAAILYKEEFERALKTKGNSGIQLLGLQDFSGQGTALIGLVDAFWDSKQLVDEAWFRQFAAPVVPLARFAKANYRADETFTANVEIANYGAGDIRSHNITWRLHTDDGLTIAQGKWAVENLPQGENTTTGNIAAELSAVEKATRATLEINIDGTPWHNSWNIWIFPDIAELPTTDIVLTADAAEAMKALAEGKKVLLSPMTENIKGIEGKFVPVFWSPVHFPDQAGTMGLLCNPRHPALAMFPTDMHSDWQWWTLAKRQKVMVIDSLPGLSPIVESVDNFTNNRRLASVVETCVGEGKLIFSSIDLLSDSSDPAVRQLLYSLLAYMQSDSFSPKGHTESLSQLTD